MTAQKLNISATPLTVC